MEEFLKQGCRLFLSGFGRPDFSLGVQAAETGRQAKFPPDVSAEFEIIRQDQVVEPLAVTLQLFVFFNEVEGFVEVLGFDVADGCFVFGDDEVRRAAPLPAVKVFSICFRYSAMGLVDKFHPPMILCGLVSRSKSCICNSDSTAGRNLFVGKGLRFLTFVRNDIPR